MRFIRKSLCLVLLAPLPSYAQTAENSAAVAAEIASADDSPGWNLGIAAVAIQDGYAREDETRLLPLPYVRYEGERFYWQMATGGYKFVRGESFTLSGFVSVGFGSSIERDDFDRSALARNGIDRDLLDDRKNGFSAGAEAAWKGPAGQLSLSAQGDVSDNSGGYEATLSYAYPLRWGETMVVPELGATWMSSDMADYYYGISEREVERGVRPYRPGSVVLPHIGASVVRALGEKWTVTCALRYASFPDEIKQSPLMKKDANSAGLIMIGFSREF